MLVVYFIHNFSRHYTATACAYSCQHHLWRHAGVGEFGEKGPWLLWAEKKFSQKIATMCTLSCREFSWKTAKNCMQ